MASPRLSRLVVTGLDGPRLDARSRRRLERLAPGGVILFRRNVVDPEQVRALTREVRAILGPRAIVSLDQEGGRVQRLRAPFAEWPPMRRIGAAGSPALAREVGRALGREVAAAGFDCDFAPVLDVDSNPANPVIGDRSFHSEPAAVARTALAFAAGLRDAGLLACGKHFPGHGDTAVDSHHALPVVRRSLRSLERLELVPFRAAIRARLPMLMTAHVVYTALDRGRPATLSPAILRGLLRERMGFRGVLATDDLGMHALDAFGSRADVGAAAVSAGCDLLLACGSLELGEEVAAGLEAAWRRGALDPGHVAEAFARLDALHRERPRGVRRPALGPLLRRAEWQPLLARLERIEARRRPRARASRSRPGGGSRAAKPRDPTAFRA